MQKAFGFLMCVYITFLAVPAFSQLDRSVPDSWVIRFASRLSHETRIPPPPGKELANFHYFQIYADAAGNRGMTSLCPEQRLVSKLFERLFGLENVEMQDATAIEGAI